MRKWVNGALLLLIASAGIAVGYYMNPAGVPPVKGFAEGKQIYFIHTEASDPQAAALMTDMMGSPVLTVPSLAEAPASIVANVYVFKNGVRGEGPFGFQPDVFDNPPGTPGYKPLRAIHFVTWKTSGAARELRTAAEVEGAARQSEIVIEESGVIVNMPLLTWPGGRR